MNIQEIDKRLDAATPGPWERKTNRHPQCNGEPWGWIEGPVGNFTWGGERGKINADFIAKTPTDIRFLLDEVKRLTAENERLTKRCDAGARTKNNESEGTEK